MKSVLIAFLLLAVGALGAFGTMGIARADEDEHRGLVGTIKNYVDADTFVLTLKRKGQLTNDVTINIVTSGINATKFRNKGGNNVDVTNYATTFVAGSHVAVLGKPNGTAYDAVHVKLIPDKGKPSHAHQVGVVTPTDFEVNALGTESITIQTKKGGTLKYTWASNPAVLKFKKGDTALSVGDRVTVIQQRDPNTGVWSVKKIHVFGPKPGKP